MFFYRIILQASFEHLRGVAKYESFHTIFPYRFYKKRRNYGNKTVMTARIYFKHDL